MTEITVVALGPGDAMLLTARAAEALVRAERLLLRTQRHGVAGWLDELGIAFETLDHLYREADDFDRLAEAVAEAVLRFADGKPGVCYGVPDPLTDATVVKLRDLGAKLTVIEGVTHANAVRTRALEAGVRFSESHLSMTATDMLTRALVPELPLIITEIDSRLLAGEVKLRLLSLYPPDWAIVLGGSSIPLSELDRQAEYGHVTSAYIPAAALLDRSRYTFADLIAIMARLRRPGDGCPWDLKQTHETLRQYIIEEAYEAVDAIHSGDAMRIVDELGDVLLQVAFHAQIASEHANFTIDDVTTAVCAKMIARHAHIWGDVHCKTPEEVLSSWESTKKTEKGLKQTVDMMRDIPAHLPQLMRAYKVQNKARQVGFDWDSPLDALDKVLEEAVEVREALAGGSDVEMELGDLLFAAANVARLSGLQPEVALGRSTEKFIGRFHEMEQAVLAAGKELSGMSLAEMDVYWDAVKKREDASSRRC